MSAGTTARRPKVDAIASARGIAARNPVAKLLASTVIAIALLLSIDPVSAGVALALELLVLPFAGVGWRRFWTRTAVVWIAAPVGALTILLYGRQSGEVYGSWLFATVSEGSVHLALATLLRVLAIALPSVVLFITVDPTDLADGLGQLLKLPSRFVIGGLAALRMLSLFGEDWRALQLARRARGVADRGRLRRMLGSAFALLTLSVRRGGSLATAMEARGFGGPTRRTWARASAFGIRDWLLVAGGVAIAAVAVGVAVVTGSWSLVVGG